MPSKIFIAQTTKEKAKDLTLSAHKTHGALENGNEISLTFMVN